jgi:hypothetical protein
MHTSDTKTNKEYKIEDLPKFFKDKSRNIRKKFSDRAIEISTIRSKSIESKTQEFSFELKLKQKINSNHQELHTNTFHKIKGLIDFFKLSLQKNKTFQYAVKIGGQELIIPNNIWEKMLDKLQDEKNNPIWDILDKVGNHALNRKKYDAREFSELSSVEQLKIFNAFSTGITIKLRANVKDINLDNFHQIETLIENKKQSQVAPQAEETKNVERKEQNETELKTTQNKQVVPFRGSFGFNVTNRVNNKAPVVFAAMEDNIPKYRIFLPLSNFFDDAIRLFFSRTPKLPTRRHRVLTYHPTPQEQERVEDETDGRKRDKILPLIPIVGPIYYLIEGHTKNKELSSLKDALPQGLGTNTSHTKPTLIQKAKKSLGVINDDDIQAQELIKQAQRYAETAMKSNEIKANEKQKTLDEIFYETVEIYRDSQNRTLLADRVFKTMFLKNIPEKDKISEEDILNILKNFGLGFNKNYLIKLVIHKKYNLQHLNEHNLSYREKSTIRKLYDETRSNLTIYKARKKAKKAIKNNNGKTHYKILVELIEEYSNQDLLTFIRTIDVVFNEVFCNGKDPSKIETFEEIFNILKILEVQFDAKYLKSRIVNKKRQLYDLTFSPKSQPPIQPENSTHKSTNPPPNNIEKNQTPHNLPANKAKTLRTNIRLKLSLENVFSSKETYFCLFVIGVSISILCLWHFPLGKVPILQGLVPQEKREGIDLILNIGLPMLIAVCVLNLAHFIYSEYKGYHIESVEQASRNCSLSK